MQKNLFDMNLKFESRQGLMDFKDAARHILDRLTWVSPEAKDWTYDDEWNMKLCRKTLSLKGTRRLNKKIKFDFILLRYFRYSHLEEPIEDEIKCKSLDELVQLFENEKGTFMWLKGLPDDVLWDWHRYCWKFRVNNEGNIVFIEKWIGSEDG